MDAELYQKIFLHLLRWSYDFIIQFITVAFTMIYGYGIIIHPWAKSPFIMVYDPSNVLLDLVC